MDEMNHIDELIEKAYKKEGEQAALELQLKQIHQQLAEEGRLPKIKSTKNMWIKRIGLLAAAASIALILMMLWWVNRDSEGQQMYANYYQPFDLQSAKALSSTMDTDWEKPYAAEDFVTAETILANCLAHQACNEYDRIYLGVIYLELEKPNRALEELREVEQALKSNLGERAIVKINQVYYFKAMAYLQLNDLETARLALAPFWEDTSKDRFYPTLRKARALKQALNR